MFKRIIIAILFLVFGQLTKAQTMAGYTGLGSKAIQRGDYPQAITYLNRSIELSAFNSEAFFLRGIAKYELEDFIGAERDFGKALELNPKNHEAYLYRGVCRSQQFNYREAFDDFNQALKLNSDDWRIYSNRALTDLRLDRYVDAISDCNRIIELKKDNSETYLLRGEAKAGLEMYLVAIEDFDRAIKKDSISMRPWLSRGVAHAKLEEYEAALKDMNKAIELDPENALPVYHRGVVQAEMDHHQQALDDFNSVLEQHPDNAIVLFNRAMVYGDMSKTNLALDDYDQVIRLNPNNILGYFNRGILLYNAKRFSESLVDLDKAIELFPEFLDAHELRLEVLTRLKQKPRYDAALKELESVRTSLLVSDDDIKYDQHVKLMKLTELKGDFEPVKKQVGKVQYRKVDVKLLPFYRISPYPETDKDISVYDGFNRPYYNIGVIALTTRDLSEKEPQKDTKPTKKAERPELVDPVRKASAHVQNGQFNSAYMILDGCIKDDPDNAACLFARAVARQVELEQHFDQYQMIYGALEITDTAYQAQTERLIALAEKDYHRVTELDPQMRFARFNLGYLLATAERYEEAETQFGAAVASGNFIEANFNRGLIRIMLGKLNKGCEDMSLAGEVGLIDSYSVIKRFCE